MGENGQDEMVESLDHSFFQSGHTVQILTWCDDGGEEFPIFNLPELIEILAKVGDCPLAIVSVNGEARGGKTTLLNFILHYMALNGKSNQKWTEKIPDDLPGFKWKGDFDHVTVGLVMWSEPIFVQDKDGRDIAVLLLDTQGSGGHGRDDETGKEAIMFCLSQWMSSVFIKNVLEHRCISFTMPKSFSDFATNFFEECDLTEPPFQHLLYVVRDWSYSKNNPYGLHTAEGSSYMNNDFAENAPAGKNVVVQQKLNSGNDTSSRSLFTLTKMFSDVSAFLLPRPVGEIATKDNDKFPLDDEDLFVKSLESMVGFLFDGYIRPKKLCGKELTGNTFMSIVSKWDELFRLKQGTLQPLDVSEVTVKQHLMTIVELAKTRYETDLNNLVTGCHNEKKLKKFHLVVRQECLKMYGEAAKLFQKIEDDLQLGNKLSGYIEVQYQKFSKINQSKQVETRLRKDNKRLTKELADLQEQQDVLSVTGKTQAATIRKLEQQMEAMRCVCFGQEQEIHRLKREVEVYKRKTTANSDSSDREDKENEKTDGYETEEEFSGDFINNSEYIVYEIEASVN